MLILSCPFLRCTSVTKFGRSALGRRNITDNVKYKLYFAGVIGHTTFCRRSGVGNWLTFSLVVWNQERSPFDHYYKEGHR